MRIAGSSATSPSSDCKRTEHPTDERSAPVALQSEVTARCEVVEEAYEFMLAYASHGLPNEEGSLSGGLIREYLCRCDAALADLPDLLSTFVDHLAPRVAAPYHAFLAVLERDARDAQAAVQLVLVQPSISSQLVDNLNASIHLRALLTDLFLLGEVLSG